jgi:hypothetical protein
MADSQPCDPLILEISAYLNEYDDDGEGRWLPATAELVDKVTGDPNHRRLLGMSEGPSGDMESGQTELHQTLSALGQRGHVVFRAPLTPITGIGPANTFHAGVGTSGDISGECHMVLNPELMDPKCIPHVIGDVFLEWLHCPGRRSSAIRGIR